MVSFNKTARHSTTYPTPLHHPTLPKPSHVTLCIRSSTPICLTFDILTTCCKTKAPNQSTYHETYSSTTRVPTYTCRHCPLRCIMKTKNHPASNCTDTYRPGATVITSSRGRKKSFVPLSKDPIHFGHITMHLSPHLLRLQHALLDQKHCQDLLVGFQELNRIIAEVVEGSKQF